MVFIPASDNPLEDKDEPLRFNIADIFITGSADNTIRTWCPEKGTPLKVLKGHKGPITCMITCPQGVILYSGSSDRDIRSWDIKAGTCLKTMDLHDGPITCLIVVNRLMYSGSQDGRARCWVREFGDCTRCYKGHKHSITSINFMMAFVIYTGSGDTCIRAFDAKTGALKRILMGHDAAVTNITIVGDKLYSSSFDGALRVWNIKSIKTDPDGEEEAEEMEHQFQKKQVKSLEDLDHRLNGYIGNDVDMDSVPDNRGA
ncbi:WD repeat-containing protein 86 [Armadillidium nasatum]|uniref:WD repeat-containing protein 86 n=1 Tax=Armadillidium nasatum TaxID=96803 RepID=A0A5N5T9S8_9CRUS|nr:WD repeat-containing protein 86 [Armadillidium nasatum]